jgi:hypothetical protein
VGRFFHLIFPLTAEKVYGLSPGFLVCLYFDCTLPIPVEQFS